MLWTLAITDKIQIPSCRGLTGNDSRFYGLSLIRRQNDVPKVSAIMRVDCIGIAACTDKIWTSLCLFSFLLGNLIWVTGAGNHKQNQLTGGMGLRLGQNVNWKIGIWTKFSMENKICYLPLSPRPWGPSLNDWTLILFSCLIITDVAKNKTSFLWSFKPFFFSHFMLF